MKPVHQTNGNLLQRYTALEAIMREIQEGEGELTPELGKQLADAEGAYNVKMEACCVVLKNFRVMIEAHEREIARLKEAKEVLENKFERLKEWVAGATPADGWNNGIHKLSWRESTAVEVGSVEKLAVEYTRLKIEADRAALKKDLEAGIVIPEAKLVKKQNLQIK